MRRCSWPKVTRPQGGGGDFTHIGVNIDYTRGADNLEEDLDDAEYEDIDDMEGESEEE